MLHKNEGEIESIFDVFAGTLSRLIYWLVLWVSPPYSLTMTSGIVGNFSLFDNNKPCGESAGS